MQKNYLLKTKFLLFHKSKTKTTLKKNPNYSRNIPGNYSGIIILKKKFLKNSGINFSGFIPELFPKNN